MDQIISVTAQGGISDSMDTFLIEIVVDPVHFASALADYTKRTLRVPKRLLLNYMESHRHAS